MKLIKTIFFPVIFSVISFSVYAEMGNFSNSETHEQWVSVRFQYGDIITARIFTEDIRKQTTLLFDFTNEDKFISQIFFPKGNDKGTIIYKQKLLVPCSIQVDENRAYETTCSISDSTDFFYTTFPLGTLGNGNYLINECKKGNTVKLRVKFNTGIIKYSYSLNGFTSAYSRAISLIKTHELDKNQQDRTVKKKDPSFGLFVSKINNEEDIQSTYQTDQSEKKKDPSFGVLEANVSFFDWTKYDNTN